MKSKLLKPPKGKKWPTKCHTHHLWAYSNYSELYITSYEPAKNGSFCVLPCSRNPPHGYAGGTWHTTGIDLHHAVSCYIRECLRYFFISIISRSSLIHCWPQRQQAIRRPQEIRILLPYHYLHWWREVINIIFRSSRDKSPMWYTNSTTTLLIWWGSELVRCNQTIETKLFLPCGTWSTLATPDVWCVSQQRSVPADFVKSSVPPRFRHVGDDT